MLRKRFQAFVHGYLSIKNTHQTKVKGYQHWIKGIVKQHFQAWLMHIRFNNDFKKKLKSFVHTQTLCHLKDAFKGWQERYISKGRKEMQQKRAIQVCLFRQQHKAWRGWGQQVMLAKDKNNYAKKALFQRVTSSCFSQWLIYTQVKLQPSQKSSFYINLMGSRSHQAVFHASNHKTIMLLFVRERVLQFVKHCTWKLQQRILTRWCQLLLRNRYWRRVEKVLQHKSSVWSKKWAFLELKQHWRKMKMFHKKHTLSLLKIK